MHSVCLLGLLNLGSTPRPPAEQKYKETIMKKKIMTIDVLGTKYNVYTDTPKDDIILTKNDGYIAPEKHIIVLDAGNNPVHMKHVMTHEIIHAFCYESGLDVETWANNEEIIDWIALQLEKIHKVNKHSLVDIDKKLYPKKKKEQEENKK